MNNFLNNKQNLHSIYSKVHNKEEHDEIDFTSLVDYAVGSSSVFDRKLVLMLPNKFTAQSKIYLSVQPTGKVQQKMDQFCLCNSPILVVDAQQLYMKENNKPLLCEIHFGDAWTVLIFQPDLGRKEKFKWAAVKISMIEVGKEEELIKRKNLSAGNAIHKGSEVLGHFVSNCLRISDSEGEDL